MTQVFPLLTSSSNPIKKEDVWVSICVITRNVYHKLESNVTRWTSCLSNCRTIQDPASQRLTWYKPPLTVLVIKKVRDSSVLPPFVQLVTWLIEVSITVVQSLSPGTGTPFSFTSFFPVRGRYFCFEAMSRYRFTNTFRTVGQCNRLK